MEEQLTRKQLFYRANAERLRQQLNNIIIMIKSKINIEQINTMMNIKNICMHKLHVIYVVVKYVGMY